MDSFQQNNPPNNNNNNNNENNPKKGKGRKKTHNNENNPKKGKSPKKTRKQKLENETNLRVTFSKRRIGLFKKGSELSTLCGVDISVVVSSPSKKAHSFGSPNVDAVASRFWNQIFRRITGPNQSSASQNNQITHQRNQDLTAIESQLVELKKNKKETDKVKRAYTLNPEDFSTQQVTEMMEFMLNFKDESSKGSDGSSGTRGLPTIDPSGDLIWDYQSFQAQQPEYNMDYHFQNMHPSGLDMTLNYPTAQFEKGSSSNANAVFPNPGQTDLIDPLDPTSNNFGYPYPNPNEASASNLMIPYNYGIPTDFVPHDDDDDAQDDDGTGTDDEEEGEDDEGEEE